ncbi:MAG: SRPBCC family protein [Candidatus Promineifilaceae bacterium]|nr:SRPBCC family protein [Candidatus Promineifilaceae bacterium]
MIQIEKNTVINRSVRDVFAYVSDVENEPEWIGEVMEVKKTSVGPIGVGSTYDNYVHFLGRRIVDPHEVVRFEPNRQFSFKSHSGQITFEGTYHFEPAGDKATRLRFVATGQTGTLFKLAEPIVNRMINRQWEANVANLKELLEAQEASHEPA